MTISTIRRVTNKDKSSVVRAAERFIARHSIALNYEGQAAEEAIECEIEMATEADGAIPRIARMWQQCFCRALGHTYDSRLTIAYGHVGLSID